MKSERLTHLLNAYLDGALTAPEKRELEDLLLSSAAARKQFWDDTRLHNQLSIVEHESRSAADSFENTPFTLHSLPSATGTEQSTQREIRPFWGGISGAFWGPFRRPFAAAAAGILVSALCTSAVWAVAAQRYSIRTKPVVVANRDFESGEQVPPTGIPNQPGMWSGDFARVVEAENGITPHSGRKMLRILWADNTLSAPGSLNYVGEATQVIDLRPYRADISSGIAQLDLGAWFASIPAADTELFQFVLKAATFRGDPSTAPTVWEDAQHNSLTLVQRQIDATGNPAQWQRIEVPIPLSEATDFLVINCAVMRRKPKQTTGSVEFPGHYLDDLTLQLRLPVAVH